MLGGASGLIVVQGLELVSNAHGMHDVLKRTNAERRSFQLETDIRTDWWIDFSDWTRRQTAVPQLL